MNRKIFPPVDCIQNEEVAELTMALSDAPGQGAGVEKDPGRGVSQPVNLVLNVVDVNGNSLPSNVRT